MTPTRPILLLLCYFLGFSIGFAQQSPGFVCGFDDLKTPAQEKEIMRFEEQLRLYFSEKGKPDVAEKSFAQPLPYVVPVVVHIIHNGGAENIPDDQVVAAIEHLNQAFAAEGYYADLGATVNTQIQFCLAERTPDGQATTGITRTQSPLTDMVLETQDIALKDLSRWEPTDYVNIWVVNEISSLSSGSGVAGYAYYPAAHGLPQDGMVCEAQYFGVSPDKDAVLIHEMGHYFGLYHTFQGNAPFVFQWSDFSTDPDLTVSQPGTYSVEVTDENGCAAIDSIVVSASASLLLSVQSSDPLCVNMPTGSINLTATGGVAPLQFLWSNNAATEDLTQLSAGIYTVVVTDANGCTATLSEILTEPPVLVLAIQQTDLTCINAMGSVDLTPGGGVPPYTFLWSNSETTEDLLVFQPGTYTVTVTDSSGCTIIGSATIITSGAAPVLSLITDTLTCVHSSGVLSATSDLPNSTFVWSGPDGFSSTSAAPVVVASGTYSVTATGAAGGCTTTGSVYVPLDTILPTVQLPAGPLELPCDPHVLSISALGSSAGNSFSTQWTVYTGGVILSGNQSLVPVIGSAGFYELSITNLINGCTARDTVEVVPAQPPTGELVADSVRCFGETNGSVRMVLTYSGKPPVLYSIDSLHFTTDSIFGNLATGMYRVFVKDANGCTTSATVEVGQPPAIAVDLTGDSIINQGETAHLQATVQPPHFNPDQIEWLPEELPLAEGQLEQSLPVLENTLFTITISDANGCTASDAWLVRVDKTIQIYVPNVIFPENPAGTNQTFLIFAGPEVLGIESLDIFDRWGDHVFSNTNFQPNDESEGWTGIFRGKPVAAGVFAWMAKVVLTDGRVELYKGDLTVVR